MGDRVLVERLDGDGREEVLPSGLVLPARDVTLRQGNSERIPDTFRARVLAVSAQAERVGIAEGDEVLVHTYDQRPDQTLVGEETRFGLLVRIDDILGVIEAEQPSTIANLTAVLGPKKGVWPFKCAIAGCTNASPYKTDDGRDACSLEHVALARTQARIKMAADATKDSLPTSRMGFT